MVLRPISLAVAFETTRKKFIGERLERWREPLNCSNRDGVTGMAVLKVGVTKVRQFIDQGKVHRRKEGPTKKGESNSTRYNGTL
jgi:hypothetical protein